MQCTQECIGSSKTVTLDIKTSFNTVVQCEEWKLAGRKYFYSQFAMLIVEDQNQGLLQ